MLDFDLQKLRFAIRAKRQGLRDERLRVRGDAPWDLTPRRARRGCHDRPPSAGPRGRGAGPVRFGLTPVFLSGDLRLLADLKAYLEAATGLAVDLVTRRTYQEITALLVAGQLDAAWICGFPFVTFRDRLALMAVPLWRGKPLYRSYLIAGRGRAVTGVADLRGDRHAYSDPDSNSGFLVTQALLANSGFDRGAFFRRAIFTYGHRNVVRAVAAGLAQSGSVDGYVLDVLADVEPELAGKVEVVRRSEWLGFPPIAAPRALEGSERLTRSVPRSTNAGCPSRPEHHCDAAARRVRDGHGGSVRSHRGQGRVVRPSPMRWLRQIPLTIKVPLLVVALMIAISAAISERVMSRLAETQERHLAELASAYLDGLAGSLVPQVLRDDIWEVFDTIDRSLTLYEGVRPVETIVTRRDGTVIAATHPHRIPSLGPLPQEYRAVGDRAVSVDEAAGQARLRRAIHQQGTEIGSIYTLVDIAPLLAERVSVATVLIVTNAALTAPFATFGYLAIARMIDPMRVLTRHMASGTDTAPSPITPPDMPPAGTEGHRLMTAYNRLVAAERERAVLASRLATEEPLASLGRLASGMAHEINNPLGGLLNALDTIKRHGDKQAVRARSVALIERGLSGSATSSRPHSRPTGPTAPADRSTAAISMTSAF